MRSSGSLALARAMLLGAALLVAGCGIRQAVYAPAGWTLSEDGTYRSQQGDVMASMPLMVVNKSDQTLHPAISVTSKGHELRYAGASWVLAGRPLAPQRQPQPDAPIDGDAPMNLHWITAGLGKIVPALGDRSALRIDLTVDGRPQSVDIPLVRRDRM